MPRPGRPSATWMSLALVVGALALWSAPGRAGASPAGAAPRCGDSQLRVASGMAVGAGGSDGFEVMVANTSVHTCSIDGYARVSFFSSAGTHIRARVLHEGSMIFATVPPRRVTLAPGSVASFAVSYGEAYTPASDAPATCRAAWMTVVLPTTHPRFYPQGDLVTPAGVDLCLADWVVGLTPIERGGAVRTN